MDKNGFTNAGTAEQTNFTTLEEGLDEVDDLDACEENLLAGGEVFETGRFAVDVVTLLVLWVGHTVNGFTNDIE